MATAPLNSNADSANKMIVVTTSWDDDHRSNLKLAELLAARGLPGTFYVNTGRLGEHSALSPTELRGLLDAGFEIGAHTVTHHVLSRLNLRDLAREVVECKNVLEEILGEEVTSFAYPKGRYNTEVIAQVKAAGYHGARGVRLLSLSCTFPQFEMPTTIQAYPHRKTGYVKNLVRRYELGSLLRSSLLIGTSKSWLELGKALFDRAVRDGGAWHLWGHAWETERIGGWLELEEMLDYVSGRQSQGVQYLTNAELFELARSRNVTAAARESHA